MNFLRIKIDWLSKANMVFTTNILNKYLEVGEGKYFDLSFIYLNKSNKKKRESFLKTFLIPTMKYIVKNNYNERKRKEIQINKFISNKKQNQIYKEIYLLSSFHNKNRKQIQKKEYIERSIFVLLKKFYQERILFSKENKQRVTEILFYSTYYEEGKEKLMLLLEYSNLIEKEKHFFMEQIRNSLFSVQSAEQIVSKIQQGSISKKQLQEFFINMEQLFLEEQKKQAEYNINMLEKEQIQILLENKAFFLEMIQEETNDILDKTMDWIREYNLFSTQRKITSVQENTKSEIEELIFYIKNSDLKEYKQFIHSILKIEMDKVKQIDDKSILIKKQTIEMTALNQKIEDTIQEIDLSLYYQEQTKKLFQKVTNFYKKYEAYKENIKHETDKENEKSKIEITKENVYKKIALEIQQIIQGITVKRENVRYPVTYKWNEEMGIILKAPVSIEIQTNKEKEEISKEYNKFHFLKVVKHVTFPNITLEEIGENAPKSASMLERLKLYYGMESKLNYNFYKRIENEYIKYKERILEQKIAEKSNLLAKKINLECTKEKLENQINNILAELIQEVVTNSRVKKIRNTKLMEEPFLLEKDSKQEKIIKEIIITSVENIKEKRNKQFLPLKDKKTKQINIQTEKEIQKDLEQLLYQILEKNVFLYRTSQSKWKQKKSYITELEEKEQTEVIFKYEKLEGLKKQKNLDISLEAKELQNFIKENTYKLIMLLQNEKNRDENNTIIYHNVQLISEELFLLYVKYEQIEEKRQRKIQQLLETMMLDKKEEIDKAIVIKIKKEEIKHQMYSNFNSFANEIIIIQSCYKALKEKIEKKSKNFTYNMQNLIIQDKKREQERILYQIKNQLKEKVKVESFRWKEEIRKKNKTELEIAVKDYFYQLIKEVIKLEREVVEGEEIKQKEQEENKNRQTKIIEEKKQIKYQQNKIINNKQEEIQINTWYQDEMEKKIPSLVERLIESKTEQEIQKQIYQDSLKIIRNFLEQKKYKEQFNIQKIPLDDVIKKIEQVQDNIEFNFFNKNLYKETQEITIACIKEMQEKVMEEANNFNKIVRKSYNKEEIKEYIEESFYKVAEEVIKIYIKNKVKRIKNKKDENEKIKDLDSIKQIKKSEKLEYDSYLFEEQINFKIKNEVRERIEIQESEIKRFIQGNKKNKKFYINDQLQQFGRELIKTIFDYEMEKELKKQIDRLKTEIIKNTDKKTEMYYLVKGLEQNLLTYKQNMDIRYQKNKKLSQQEEKNYILYKKIEEEEKNLKNQKEIRRTFEQETNPYSLKRKNIIYKKKEKFSKYSIDLEQKTVLQEIIKKRLENQYQFSLYQLQQNKKIQKKILEKSNLTVKENTTQLLNLYKDKSKIEKNRNREVKKIVCYMNQKIEKDRKESLQKITKNIIQIYMMYEIKNQVNEISNELSNELLKKFTIYQKAQIVNQVKQMAYITTEEVIKKREYKTDSRYNSLDYIIDNLSEWILREQIHFDNGIINTDSIIKNQKRKKEIQKNIEKLLEHILYQQNEKRENQYSSKIKNSKSKEFQNINTFYYNIRHFFEEMYINFDKEETNIKNHLKQKDFFSTQEFIKDAKLFYRLISMGTEETAKETFDWIITENLFQNSRGKKRKQKKYNIKQRLCYLIQNATKEEYQEFVMHLQQDRKIIDINKKYDIQEKSYQKSQYVRQQYDMNQQERLDLTYVKQYDLNKQEGPDLTYINQYNLNEQEKADLTYIEQNDLSKEEKAALEYKNQEYYLQQRKYEIKQKNILNWKEQYEQQWNAIKKIYNEWIDKTKKEIKWNVDEKRILYKQIELQPILEQLLKNNIFFNNKNLKEIEEKQINKNNIQIFKSQNTQNDFIRHTRWKNQKHFLEYLKQDKTKKLLEEEKSKHQRDEKSETDDLRKKVNESQKKVMEHTKMIKQLQKELEEQKKIILKTKETEQNKKETILKNKIIAKEVIQELEWKLDMEKVSRGLD